MQSHRHVPSDCMYRTTIRVNIALFWPQICLIVC